MRTQRHAGDTRRGGGVSPPICPDAAWHVGDRRVPNDEFSPLTPHISPERPWCMDSYTSTTWARTSGVAGTSRPDRPLAGTRRGMINQYQISNDSRPNARLGQTINPSSTAGRSAPRPPFTTSSRHATPTSSDARAPKAAPQLPHRAPIRPLKAGPG